LFCQLIQVVLDLVQLLQADKARFGVLSFGEINGKQHPTPALLNVWRFASTQCKAKLGFVPTGTAPLEQRQAILI
jgi:hypothetical protein